MFEPFQGLSVACGVSIEAHTYMTYLSGNGPGAVAASGESLPLSQSHLRRLGLAFMMEGKENGMSKPNGGFSLDRETV